MTDKLVCKYCNAIQEVNEENFKYAGWFAKHNENHSLWTKIGYGIKKIFGIKTVQKTPAQV